MHDPLHIRLAGRLAVFQPLNICAVVRDDYRLVGVRALPVFGGRLCRAAAAGARGYEARDAALLMSVVRAGALGVVPAVRREDVRE